MKILQEYAEFFEWALFFFDGILALVGDFTSTSPKKLFFFVGEGFSLEAKW